MTHPSLRISETILKTARIGEMRAWYRAVLELEPSIEHMPDGAERFEDGSQRASGMRLCFFELNEDYPYFQTLGMFEVPNTSLARNENSPGLHHMQFHAGTMDALISRFEVLDAQGIRPVRTMNHGTSMSFYYADPDGNTVELTASNFAHLNEYRRFLKSDRFRQNPSGFVIDPDELRRRFRSGQSIEELREIIA
jgi:catechol 2,3-dioxygenase-like lactoylglutathione lyase family enzyme